MVKVGEGRGDLSSGFDPDAEREKAEKPLTAADVGMEEAWGLGLLDDPQPPPVQRRSVPILGRRSCE